ncbi:MAG TPA: hypothetical protein VF183_07320 [Acidimicrobiales bacterium]
MSTVNKPTFPTLICIGRHQQAATWEAIMPDQFTQRVTQLENDPTVLWFYAYDVASYRPRAAKKTTVITERPDVANPPISVRDEVE